MPADGLHEYRRRRDPARTPEPVPQDGPLPTGGDDTFVVQEHHARALHWDFRLERDGVLVSWALPKGLPQDPKVNHLAVHTEDHPLEYAGFAGVIPAGEYGGGQVGLWDRGRYETQTWTEREVKVVLHGQRVQGRFALFRTRGRNWMIHRMDGPPRPDWQPLPTGLVPMQAEPGEPLGLGGLGGGWAFEPAWDGVRALALVEGGRVRLGDGDRDLTAAFPELAGMGAAVGATQLLLDGELVVVHDGRLDPERLRQRDTSPGGAAWRRLVEQVPVTYLVTDLLQVDGRPLLGAGYRQRRQELEALRERLTGPTWQITPTFDGPPGEVLAAVTSLGVHAVLAKRLTSPYRPGQVSADWRRIEPR